MEILRGFLFISITKILFPLNSSNVEGRSHFHKKQRSKDSNKGSPVSDSPVSQSPVYAPEPESPVSPPSVPADPVDPGNTSSACVFDVTSFGAVGDGCTDDTAAFRAAWKEACAVESALVLAPSDLTFFITSTIFSGPCKPGVVFKVDGVLMPPNGPDCWPKSDSKLQWLVFYRLDDMTFTGSGTIEGNGVSRSTGMNK